MGIAAFNPVLLGLFIATQTPTGPVGHNEGITIDTRVLVIHALQSKMVSGGVLKDGRVYGVVIGGNVTANYPEGIIVLEAPSDREDHEFVRLIKDKVSSHPCSCGDFVQISPWRRFQVTLDSCAAGHKVYEIHNKIIGRGEYWLHFAIDVDQKAVFLNFLCEAIYYDSLKFDKRGRIVREELFNRTIPLIWDQALLVGFAPPKSKDGGRGNAYWFIVKERT
jgi:hypothetical protein